MNFSPIRCDQCIKRHRKCNKLKPSCSRCLKLKIECTYFSKSQITRNLLGLEKSMKIFKVSSEEMKDDEDDQVGNFSESTWIVVEFNKKKEDKSVPKNMTRFDKSSTPLKFLSNYAHMSFLEFYMSILQYPSTYKMNQELKVILWVSKGLLSSLNYYSPNSFQLSTEKPSTLQFSKLINIAIENYMKFNNQAFPMFIEKDFDFNSKPLSLRLAIIAAGLFWLKDDRDAKALTSYLQFKIYDYIRFLHKIPPRLESIQLLLIELIWIRIPNRTNEYFKTLAHCSFISDIIGLHLTSKKLDTRVETERSLTYSSFITFNLSVSLVSGSYISWPTKPNLINKSYTKLIKAFNLHADIKNWDINHRSNIILTSFYCDLGSIFISLRLLKNRYLLNSTAQDRLDKISTLLLTKIEEVKIKYINSYKILCSEKSDLNDLISFVEFLCNYTKFYIYSLYFFSPKLNYSRESFSHSSQIFDLALKYAQQTIKNGCKSSYNLLIVFGIPFIFQCTIFLLRHNKHEDSNINEAIGLAGSFFDKVKDYKGNVEVLTFNQSLIYTIQSVFKETKGKNNK